MNIIITVLRLVHIVSAVAWVGLALSFSAFIAPAANAAGEAGLRFLKKLFEATRFSVIFPVASGLTMLMGILLYVTGDPSTSFSRTGQIVLGIGALAGLAAGIHGGAVLNRSTKAYAASLAKYPDGQPIPADGITALQAEATQVNSHLQVSIWLVVIALIAMAGARYL